MSLCQKVKESYHVIVWGQISFKIKNIFKNKILKYEGCWPCFKQIFIQTNIADVNILYIYITYNVFAHFTNNVIAKNFNTKKSKLIKKIMDTWSKTKDHQTKHKFQTWINLQTHEKKKLASLKVCLKLCTCGAQFIPVHHRGITHTKQFIKRLF